MSGSIGGSAEKGKRGVTLTPMKVVYQSVCLAALLLGAVFAAPASTAPKPAQPVPTKPKTAAKAPLKIPAKAPAKTAAPVGNAGIVLSQTQDLLRTTVKDGKTVQERVSGVSAVLPGSMLLEETTVKNTRPTAAQGVVVRIAVPQGTRFQGATTSPRWRVDYSADNGKTFAALNKAAPAYNMVRFTIAKMQPREVLKVGFKVIVE